MVCQSIYNKKTGKQKIMNVDVVADFIEPSIEFSEKLVTFRQDVVPGQSVDVLEQEVSIGNVSSLSLTATLSVDAPFSLIALDGSSTQSLVSFFSSLTFVPKLH